MQDQYVSFSAAWFTLSLVNAGLAQSKQRSGLNWWLVSLLLGPLATLLIVAWPPGGAGYPQGMPAGTMDRRQAMIIGAVILLLVAGVLAVVSLAGSP
jgi:hypothetical protein